MVVASVMPLRDPSNILHIHIDDVDSCVLTQKGFKFDTRLNNISFFNIQYIVWPLYPSKFLQESERRWRGCYF